MTGARLLLLPRSFYYGVLGVSALPPYNEHLMRDLGGLYLAMAVVLGAAGIRLQRSLVRTALAAYLVTSVTHLSFHVTHPAGLDDTVRVTLLGAQSLLVVLPVALLLLTRAMPSAGSAPPSHGSGVWPP